VRKQRGTGPSRLRSGYRWHLHGTPFSAPSQQIRDEFRRDTLVAIVPTDEAGMPLEFGALT
jgi:hypothetical protein